MQKIILYIQPQLRNTTTEQDFVRVDLMEEGIIELTQVIQDIKDIEKVFTDYSRTFNLPASKTNNKIFKHWYNPDIDGFDNQIISNARIELNHLEFRFGKIKLEQVVMKNQVASMYKVTFFGNTISIKDMLKDDKLNNLTWLDNFNYINTHTNVKDGFSSGLDYTIGGVAYNKGIIFPLIAHSNPWTYSQNNTGHPNPSTQYNLAVTGVAIANRGVFPEDLKPAIPVKNIIKAIDEQYDLTIKSGEFFDSDVFDNMYMWLNRDKGKMKVGGTWVGDTDAYTCSGTTCTDLSDSTYYLGFFDITTGIYLWKKAPLYDTDTTTIRLTITPASGYENIVYNTEIFREIDNKTFVKKTSLTGTNNVFMRIGDGLNGYSIDELHNYQPNGTSFLGKVTSEFGFNFEAKFEINRTVNTVFSDGSTATRTLNGVFTSNSSSLSVTGGLVYISHQIPEMKVIDFLKGLFKMFNLTAFIDNQNQLVVKTLDSYYSSGNTHDITEFVKTDENIILPSIQYKNINLKYPEPKTILAQRFEKNNNTQYGCLEYESDIKEGGEYNITVPFSHMLYERVSNNYISGGVSFSELTLIQTGVSIDEDLNPVVDKPLIFYVIDNKVNNATRINFAFNERPEDGSLPTIDAGDSAHIVSNYFMPSNASSSALGGAPQYLPNATAPTYNLNFGSEINSESLTDYGGNNNSLFQKFYQNYITRLFNKKTRLFQFSAILPLKVLLNVTLDDLIVVGTRAYTINKMTTKLQSGETSFELLNEPS
jgi:hypothetical protein